MTNDRAKNIHAIYPLSPMQQGMLFHSVYNEEQSEYFEQFTCKLQGELNVSAFERALEAIIARHSVLRTAFVWKTVKSMLQVVHNQVELPLQHMDWSEFPEDVQTQKLHELLESDKQQGFNLAKAPLMRFFLIKLAPQLYQFYWSFHHLLTDGWSLPIVLKEVFTLYEANVANMPLQLPPARPYQEYIKWLQAQDMDKAKEFWRELLKDYSAPIQLMSDRVSAAELEGKPEYQKLKHECSPQLSKRLTEFTRQQHITMNTLVQGAWAYLLHRYSGEKDVVFGATVSGRPPALPDVERMVGLFINTLPIRLQIDSEKNVSEWLKLLQAQAFSMREYEYTPLVEIHGVTKVPRDQALFNSIVVFENYPVDRSMQEQQASLKFLDFKSFERTNYPFTLVVGHTDTLVLEIAYESKRFAEGTVQRFLQHLERILIAFMRQPHQSIAQVPILSDTEIEAITVNWNHTQRDFDRQACIHQLVEARAEQTPDALALKFNEQTLTYNEFNARANQWAHYLHEAGLQPEDRVAIYLERSIEMIVAIFAVLKAGGAYVPIDPNYPQERVNYILQDSGARVLLSQASLLGNIVSSDVIKIDMISQQTRVDSYPQTNPDQVTFSENLAYVIYTSGSTGKPKGTLLQHRGAVNMVDTFGRVYEIYKCARILQFASLGFDASVAEIFMALTHGAALYIVDRETAISAEKLYNYIRDEQICKMTLPPSVLAVMESDNLPNLHVVVSAGEEVTTDVAKRWAQGRTYINGYGPTENSVGSTFCKIKPGERVPSPMPIGRPFDNVRTYVLDEHLSPVPIGAAGELCIAGDGLARGYLNRPELTAERFVPDPFTDFPGSRMYRSGDLVRYLPDGNVEFLGRIDFQVKIRGFRIELGEIESLLGEYPALRDAVVLAKENQGGQKMLVAYYVSENGNSLDSHELQDHIRAQLPDYMVPQIFVPLAEFPLTTNGKIDRRALPEPDFEEFAALREFVAPRNPTEEILTGIWQDILKLERVGVTDNFFDLGGHSLLATQLVSRIRDAFSIELPLRQLFDAPTIAHTALLLDQEKLTEGLSVAPPIQPREREGDIPLSFAQHRLWFLDQLAPGQAFYNIPGAFRLSGDLNRQMFHASLAEIIKRHESLRTTFDKKRGEPFQIIHNSFEPAIQEHDFSNLPESEKEQSALQLAATEAQTAFDLAKGPLLRVHLVKMTDQEHIVIFNMHHIISDGWSMGVLVSEFAQLYEAFLRELPSPLPELSVQYADYVLWQRDWLQGEVLEQQLEYWKSTIGVNPPVLELPFDKPRPSVQTFHGDSVNAMFSKSLLDRIQLYCQKQGVTPFMFLLATFQMLMYRYSGQSEFLVGSPIANRTQSETESLIGFFVNTLVFKADFTESMDFQSFVRQVREITLNAYAHQDIPFEQLVEALQPERDMSHSPLFQVAFMLQNAPFEQRELSGLTISPVEASSETAKYDLTVTTVETETGLACSFEYNVDLFNRSSVERMVQHFRQLLENVLVKPKAPVASIPFMSPEEEKTLLSGWNDTTVAYPDSHSVHGLFEEWAAKQPQAEAVRFGESSFCYDELNRRANQLARALRTRGVGQDDIVGISMHRSLDVPVAILGILKAGAAFLSIDPTYPKDRIAYMLEDSELRILLTQERIVDVLPKHSAETIVMDREWPDISKKSAENLNIDTTPEQLSYVIYTSGSTGKPKGTLLPHRGLCNLHRAQRAAFDITPNFRMLQFAPLSFDASVWETVMALLNGACLVCTDQETLASGHGLRDVIKSQRVNIVTLPPSVLSVMPEDELPDLKTIVTAGEACSLELVKRWGKGRQYVNAYGPTETTVCASYYETSVDDEKAPPIGKPLQNFQLYVLDKHWNPVPVGVPGELCVGGVGLARGYHKRPDLTADKFIPDPFSGEAGARLYRTGDLVKYLPDGNIEFLGRIDHQVKVRGFRIELGEIEAVISKQAGVTDVIVLVREDSPGDQRIVAYVVSDQEINVADLKAGCRADLPEYMIPSAFVVMDEFPLTPSQKIDHRALPKPELSRDELASEFVEPRNDIEKKLAAIVSDLLKVDNVGIHDSFFELGGHSLLATQFISELMDTFEVDIPLITVFEKPTIADLAQAIEQIQNDGDAIEHQRIEQADEEAIDLLSDMDGLSDEELKLLLDEG